MTEDKLWTHKVANDISTRSILGGKTTLVIYPEDAYLLTGDTWMMCKFPFEDGDGEEQAFSAFDSVSDDVWDELVELVRDWDRRRGDRTIAVTDVLASYDGEYLNLNPSEASKVATGMDVGDALQEWGYVEP